MKPYYSEYGITIYHMDHVVSPEFLSTLDAADLVCTDPPYGTTASKWDTAPDLNWFWTNVQMHKDAAAVFTASQPFTSELVMSNRKAFKHEWIWKKNRSSNFLNAKIQPLKVHESVIVFCRGKLTYNPQITDGHPPVNFARRKANSSTVYGFHAAAINNAGDTTRYPTSVLDIRCLDNISKERVHPNQKPIELMRYLISTYSKPGDLVLDPWMGSGTTGVAAKELGRRCVMVDGDEGCCELAAGRLQQGILIYS